MVLLLECLALLCILSGAASLIWITFGRLLWPVGGPEASLRAVVVARGDGGALEHTVRGLGWLGRAGLWRGSILIVDGGLTDDGAAVAERLAREGRAELRRDTGEETEEVYDRSERVQSN